MPESLSPVAIIHKALELIKARSGNIRPGSINQAQHVGIPTAPADIMTFMGDIKNGVYDNEIAINRLATIVEEQMQLLELELFGGNALLAVAKMACTMFEKPSTSS